MVPALTHSVETDRQTDSTQELWKEFTGSRGGTGKTSSSQGGDA